jgi:hypothetical protein
MTPDNPYQPPPSPADVPGEPPAPSAWSEVFFGICLAGVTLAILAGVYLMAVLSAAR